MLLVASTRAKKTHKYNCISDLILLTSSISTNTYMNRQLVKLHPCRMYENCVSGLIFKIPLRHVDFVAIDNMVTEGSMVKIHFLMTFSF